MIYLDYNATTPVLPEVRDAMWPYLTNDWGNPSSGYAFGARAKTALGSAREKVAALVKANPEEVIFTSCATEANNTAIYSALSSQPEKRHLITTEAEHSSVLGYSHSLQSRGYDLTLLPIDTNGFLDIQQLGAAIRPDTALVSVMWANNETGVISPIKQIAEICSQYRVRFHCDAAQAVGKLPIDLTVVPIDYLSLSGHKLGASKGIGALVLRKGTSFEPFLVGGKQESGRRGGTESVPLIVGLGVACDICEQRISEAWTRLRPLRDLLESSILSEFPGSYRNGSADIRLPNTLNFGILGNDGDEIVTFMDSRSICVSSGSACLQNSITPSHVILAMTGDYGRANEALRVSLGPETTQDELRQFLDALHQFVTLAT